MSGSILFFISKYPGRVPATRITVKHNGRSKHLFLRTAESNLPAEEATKWARPRIHEIFLNAVDLEDL